MGRRLPKDDANARLQRQSLKAFNTRVPEADFIVRPEIVADYGVDLSVEAVVGDHATNYRSQIQMKGRSGLLPNSDGSYSVSIKTANLNYLLQGQCPFYVLYRPEDESLWYVSAHLEARRLASANSAYLDRKSVTLRLSLPLDEAGFAAIHHATIVAGQLTSQLLSDLHALTPGRSEPLSYGNLLLSDSSHAREMLVAGGIQLVAAGQADQVMELANSLPLADVRDPKVALVLAYAEHSRGRFRKSESYLADVDLSLLSVERRGFAQFLELASSVAGGTVSAADYAAKLEAWAEGEPDSTKLQYRLLAQHRRANGLKGRERETELDKLFREAQRIASDTTQPRLSRAYAERYCLDIESERIANRLSRLRAFAQASDAMRARVFQGASEPEVIHAFMVAMMAWESRVAALLEVAETENHAPFRCSMMYTRELGRSVFFMAATSPFTGTENQQIPIEEALAESGTIARLEALIAFAESLCETEISLLSKLLLVRVLDRADDSRVPELAGRLAREARLHGHSAIATEAADFAAGRSNFRDLLAVRERDRLRSPDERLRHLDENEIDELSLGICESLHIPSSRAPNVANSMRATAHFAQMRFDWCQHIEVVQAVNPDMDDYSQIPEKKARCRLHGSTSTFPSRDALALSRAFTRSHCAECADRDALRR